MPALEAILIGVAILLGVLAVLPAGRRLLATAGDVIDASVAAYAIRQALGRDTTTGRERRIAARRAREQSDILRRIGAVPLPTGPDEAVPPTAVAPSRLVVAGERTGLTAAADRARPGSRGLAGLVRSSAIVAVALAIMFSAVTLVLQRPTGGVLGVTGSPGPSAAPVVSAAAVTAPSNPVGAPPASSAPAPGAVATAPVSSAAPAVRSLPGVEGLSARLARQSTIGSTVDVELSWRLADGPAEVTGFHLMGRSGTTDTYERLATLEANARSHVVELPIGTPVSFRLVPLGPEARAGIAAEWPSLTADRLQETASHATTRGPWRAATGPSLSGGSVLFSGTRGARFTIPFDGIDVGWVGTRTPMSGRAEVRVDGQVVGTRDLAADTVAYRRLILRQHLGGAGGRHVLEIRPLGDGRVDVDAILVLH